jgi:hypothetical protein
MRVLRSLATGRLPGLLLAAAAAPRPERGRHPGRAAARVDGGAVKTIQRQRPATARMPGHDGRRALSARCDGLANTLHCQRDRVIGWLLALLLCNCAIGHAATVEYLVVGGGGGGGGYASQGGGGGAGGVLYNAAHVISAGTFSVTVGAGGAGATNSAIATNGGNSIFATVTAIGGGHGASWNNGVAESTSRNGCSGGGGAWQSNHTGGTGTAGQGNAGGNGGSTTAPYQQAGGGGAGGAGRNGAGATPAGIGTGGIGVQYSQFAGLVASTVGGAQDGWFGGGGGGSQRTGTYDTGGAGGRGGGGNGGLNGRSGLAGTGGGGGGGDLGGGGGSTAGNGGSGIVIIRYRTDGSDGINAATTTGGTKTTSGIYTVHTFTASGTFTVVATAVVEYLIVAGGGGGNGGDNANGGGGGGGGGGLLSGISAVSAQSYTITVGGGGLGGLDNQYTETQRKGGDSAAFGFIAIGGGGGARFSSKPTAPYIGANGGSGGGGFRNSAAGGSPTAGQGFAGGAAGTGKSPDDVGGGGGGGAGAVGSNGTNTVGGAGGAGASSSISGSAVTYAGGGGGGADTGSPGAPGGSGGGGAGGAANANGTAGTNGLGGGGGGGSVISKTGGAGGSGIVIIRYKTDGSDGIHAPTTTGGTKTTSGIYTIHTFTTSGTFTVSTPGAAPHRLEIQHCSGTGLTCTPSTVTVRACADAACTTPYTSGVSGTLQATGGSVTWPATAAFTIPSGSSSTTVNLQSTTTTPTVLGVASSTPAASNAATCNFGSPACTFTAADAGFIFDVPNHVAEAAQTVSVSAVRKSDNSTACTPAFASTSKAVTFRCTYTNPTTGTLPVRVGSTALNASASAAAACDAGGRAVSLAFNASGVASTTVQYADVGQVLLSARFAGAAGGSEAGLVMTGSDSFIAVTARFAFSGVSSGPIKAGSGFSATVSALNSSGGTTPNFGRETSAETLFTGWARIQPTGSGAVNGSFSGSFGSFSGGSASATNLAWTEVGRGDLLVRSTNASGYLGSTLLAYGSSAGLAITCANESGSCVLPGGTTATVYYGEDINWVAKVGQTGTVACNSTNFGDPLPGWPKKCLYVATGATNGSVGDFIPHRFTVAASNACGTFSYAGQPMAATVTARNAAGNTTVNFNGTATTTPAFAQAVTFADANGLAVGTLSDASIAAGAFSAGVASGSPSYSFTSKATAPQSLVLRATNGASGAALVSSAGYAEPTLPLRSGRLRLSNAFGKATAALQVPVVTEHWGGSAWQLNSADSCTALAGSSIALSNPRAATGATSAATSSAGAVAISGGNGILTLAAPSPAGSSLSLDLAVNLTVNLGSAGTDQSCNTNKPASTGAALPWLRAQNGSCAATADRDPAARASFGIFAPETRKTVHVRDLY